MKNYRLPLFLLSISAAVSVGCASARPPKPRSAPPTPKTVTRSEPGGDAADPQLAALRRLGKLPWGWRNDKRDVVHFPLTDWKNWRRVRFWGVPTFVGFRYGDKHRAVAAMWLTRLHRGEPEDPRVCIAHLKKWGMPMADLYRTTVTMGEAKTVTWQGHPDVLVQTVDATVEGLFSDQQWRAVAGASLPWPRVCMVYGYAFRVDDSPKQAEATRDRYAREAFSRLELTHPKQAPRGFRVSPKPGQKPEHP